MAHILYKYGKTSMNPVAIAAGNGGGWEYVERIYFFHS
jgi:hypothetical protein